MMQKIITEKIHIKVHDLVSMSGFRKQNDSNDQMSSGRCDVLLE
jgi:hypothetical protein